MWRWRSGRNVITTFCSSKLQFWWLSELKTSRPRSSQASFQAQGCWTAIPQPSNLGLVGAQQEKDSSCFLTGREVWMGGRNGWSLLILIREKLGVDPDLPFFGREAVRILDSSRDTCETGITGLIQSRRIFGGQTLGHRMIHSSCLEDQPV